LNGSLSGNESYGLEVFGEEKPLLKSIGDGYSLMETDVKDTAQVCTVLLN